METLDAILQSSPKTVFDPMTVLAPIEHLSPILTFSSIITFASILTWSPICASLAINASNLNCDRDDSGKCIKVNLCGDVEGQGEGDCLSEAEERAWSSPVFIKSAGGQS